MIYSYNVGRDSSVRMNHEMMLVNRGERNGNSGLSGRSFEGTGDDF